MRIGRILLVGAVALLASSAAQPTCAVTLSAGDSIALDWSTTGDADGGDLSNWNQTDDGQVDIAAGSVIRHSDGAVVDDVTISFQNGVAGNFNNDAAAGNPVFLPNDPFFVAGADDIYFHGDAANNLITTFGGLDISLGYEVRIYNSLNRNPSALFTDHIVNGVASGAIGEFEAWSANTLEDSGLVFDEITPNASGEIVIELVPAGGPFYPLQAMVITALTPDRVTLQVNTDTGLVTMLNGTSTDFDVKGYSISSPSESLNPAGWNSLQEAGFADQGDGAGNTDPTDGVGWEQLGDGSIGTVAEFNLQSSSIFGPGGAASQSLGALFATGGTEDLVLELSLANGATSFGIVEYVTGGLTGDYNGDGVVDAADYTVWRDNLGGDASAFASGSRDPGATGPIGTDDYDSWRANFGNSVGSLDAAGSAVPEPSALCALASAVVVIAVRRRSTVIG